MKLLSMDKALLRRRILRINVFLGVLVFFAAFVVNVAGDYNSLVEIKTADTLFYYVGIGGLLYSAFFMIFCVMSKPFWFPQNN